MEKKVIVLTGASGGMGTALTNWFIQQEYNLVLHAYSNQISLPSNEHILFVTGDLREEKTAQELIDRALERFGRIDVVINNAGISRSAMSWKTAFESWKETMAINLDAPFLVCKAVIPHMRAQKSGSIINISSVVAQTGAIGTAAYAASKAGLIGLTKTLSKELASANINVNALALGYFNTGIIEDVPAEIQTEIIKTIPMNRLGDPEAVCKTIDWLIAAETPYVTGQVINLNGGMYS